MKNCPECFNDVPDDARFCVACGARLIPLTTDRLATPTIDRFQASQFEADLLTGGLMRWLTRIYGPKYGSLCRIIIDIPWPPAPMTISCMDDADAVIISAHPEATLTDYATPMLGLLQEVARNREASE